MKKEFVLACVAAFLLLNEDFNHLIVMVVVGGYEFEEAWAKTFRNWTLEGFLVVGMFRAIPFAMLILCAAFTNALTQFKGKLCLWLGYAVSVFVIFIGYWHVTEALYTDAHAASTSSFGYIYTPIAAVFYSLVVCIAIYFVIWLYEFFSKRA